LSSKTKRDSKETCLAYEDHDEACTSVENLKKANLKIQFGLVNAIADFEGEQYRVIRLLALEGERICGGVEYNQVDEAKKNKEPLDGCHEPFPVYNMF